MRNRLLHSVTLGLSIAMCSLAGANALVPAAGKLAAPPADAVAAQRRVIDQHLALHDTLHRPALNSDLNLLQRHHRDVTMATGAASSTKVALHSAGNSTLLIDGHQFVVHAGDGPKPATVESVAQMGMTDPKMIATAIKQALLTRAGMKGDANDDHVMNKAREAIETQIKDTAALATLAKDVGAHADVSRMMRLLKAMSQETGQPAKPLRLATAGGVTLEVQGTGHNRAGITQEEQQVIRVVGEGNGKPRDATVADLARFGLGTQEGFEAAVGHAMINLYAPEDLLAGHIKAE